MSFKFYSKVTIDANQLSLDYHVNCMIIVFLQYVSTGSLTEIFECSVGFYMILVQDWVPGKYPNFEMSDIQGEKYL